MFLLPLYLIFKLCSLLLLVSKGVLAVPWLPLVYLNFNISKRHSTCYSLHRKKVYTCDKAKFSKLRGARGKVEGAPHPPLSWSKMRLGPVWTNSMVGLAHPLLFIWPPWVLSTWLDKSVYFLLRESVIQIKTMTWWPFICKFRYMELPFQYDKWRMGISKHLWKHERQELHYNLYSKGVQQASQRNTKGT